MLMTDLRTAIFGTASGAVAVRTLFKAQATKNPQMLEVAGATLATIGAVSTMALGMLGLILNESTTTASMLRAAIASASGTAIILAANSIRELAKSPTATTAEKAAATVSAIIASSFVILEATEIITSKGMLVGTSLIIGIAGIISARKAKKIMLKEGFKASPKAILVGIKAATITGLAIALIT